MAKLKTLRNGRIALPFGILLLALCFLFLAHSAWQQREAHWRDQLFLDARAQLNGMRHAQQAMRGEAQIAVYSLREDPDIQRLIRRICLLIDQHGRGHPEVQRLRAQLISDLDGFWHLLQQAGAKELQIHLAADQTALLRMQNPESWGDRHDAARPLLRSVAASGIQQSGLTLHLHGASESAVAPIMADDSPDSPPVATLQIGFPAFTASPASQSEGLALLIDSATLAPGALRSPLPALGRGRWLLADELGGPLPD